MNREELEKQQDELVSVDGPIFTVSKVIPVLAVDSVRGFMVDILNYEEDIVREVLGDFGLRLREFAVAVDSEHPDLWCAFSSPGDIEVDGWLGLFSQYLKLGEFAKREGLDIALTNKDRCLRKIVTKQLPKELKYLDSPFKTQRFVRFLPQQDQRDEVRATKSVKPIDLRTFYRRGQAGWDEQPQNFGMYIRFSKAHEEEASKAEKKANRYMAMGCKNMADKIREDINQFKQLFDECYLGFHRITMTSAAVVLAKMHGFGLMVEPQTDEVAVAAPDTSFSGYFGTLNHGMPLYYRPHAYPLHKMKKIPDRVQQLLVRLENLPDVQGKAAFDHYIVIVPSVSSPENLDEIFIKEQMVVPVLLGEKDGSCYFISYWI